MQENKSGCFFPEHSVYTQCVHEKQSQLLLAQRDETATKRYNFWHSDLGDNCDSGYDYVSGERSTNRKWL